MTEAEELLLRACVGFREEWTELLGSSPATEALNSIATTGKATERDLAVVRNGLRDIGEICQVRPPVGHAMGGRQARIEAFLRKVPAGWTHQREESNGEVWLVHGMAPLATADLAWIYAETLRSERVL